MAKDEEALRSKAWVGDAVLALFAREWILRQTDIAPSDRAEVFKSMTSNHFLSAFGPPTQMEAEIGTVYESDGLAAAFSFIEARFLPIFQQQHRNRVTAGGWRGRGNRSGRK